MASFFQFLQLHMSEVEACCIQVKANKNRKLTQCHYRLPIADSAVCSTCFGDSSALPDNCVFYEFIPQRL